MERITILKTREIINKNNMYQKLILFSDNSLFLFNTNKHQDKSTTFCYAVTGFNNIGEVQYLSDGMKIGESENNKSALDNHITHVDRFFNKIEYDVKRYYRIKEALFT